MKGFNFWVKWWTKLLLTWECSIHLRSLYYIINKCEYQVVNHALTQSPSSLVLRISYTHEIWYWCKTIVWCIVSKTNQTSFGGGIGALDRRSNFVVSKPCKIKPWICNTTCKNCARITTYNDHIVKCKENHSLEELCMWKECRSSIIEKLGTRKSYKNRAWRSFRYGKNIGTT